MRTCKLSLRFLAYLFDGIILIGLLLGLMLLADTYLDLSLLIQELNKNFDNLIITKTVAILLSFGILYLIYEISFICSSLSATPGKLLMNIEVFCMKKANFLKVFFRSFLKTLVTVLWPIAIPITLLITYISKSKQLPHDLLTSTVVVKKNTYSSSISSADILFMEMQERGLNSYDEQLALMQELDLSSKLTDEKAVAKSYKWIGALFLVISILCSVIFTTFNNTAFNKYFSVISINSQKSTAYGIRIEKNMINKYLGNWATKDKKISFEIRYKSNYMFISTGKTNLKFRFDNDMLLYLTYNNSEYKLMMEDDSVNMSKLGGGDTETYSLYK